MAIIVCQRIHPHDIVPKRITMRLDHFEHDFPTRRDDPERSGNTCLAGFGGSDGLRTILIGRAAGDSDQIGRGGANDG